MTVIQVPTAHSTSNPGLRQHSIGSTYPVIVVARGKPESLSWEVHLGKHYCPRLTHESAMQLAERIAAIYHKDGWNAAVIALTAYAIKVGVNS